VCADNALLTRCVCVREKGEDNNALLTWCVVWEKENLKTSVKNALLTCCVGKREKGEGKGQKLRRTRC
jgi:hypothetical protein